MVQRTGCKPGSSKASLQGHVRTDCEGICPPRSRSRECIYPAIALECIESEAGSERQRHYSISSRYIACIESEAGFRAAATLQHQ